MSGIYLFTVTSIIHKNARQHVHYSCYRYVIYNYYGNIIPGHVTYYLFLGLGRLYLLVSNAHEFLLEQLNPFPSVNGCLHVHVKFALSSPSLSQSALISHGAPTHGSGTITHNVIVSDGTVMRSVVTTIAGYYNFSDN